jgi:hypothetical protein
MPSLDRGSLVRVAVPIVALVTPSSLECLACGERRSKVDSVHSHLATGECPRCGYVGWAPATDLTEYTRRALRDRPVERRRLWLRRAS